MKALTPEERFQMLKKVVIAWREVRAVGWVIELFPVEGREKLPRGSGRVRTSIAMDEDDASGKHTASLFLNRTA